VAKARRTAAAQTQKAADPAFKFPPEASVGYLLRDTYRAFSRLLQARLAPHGVTMGMWFFLRALWQDDGLTQRELSRRVGMMEPTTVSALNHMERRGLIKRVRNTADRRKVNVFLTREGRALEPKLLPYALEVNQIVLREIAPEEAQVLRELFGRMKRALAEVEAAGGDPPD
jgi:DNA-binding MarR family transcriptional regulator